MNWLQVLILNGITSGNKNYTSSNELKVEFEQLNYLLVIVVKLVPAPKIILYPLPSFTQQETSELKLQTKLYSKQPFDVFFF